MSTTTTAAATMDQSRSLTRRIFDACRTGGQMALKHPLSASWWTMRHLPFSGYLLLIWAMLSWFRVGDTMRFGNTMVNTESVMLTLASLSVSAEVLRVAIMRVDRLRLFQILLVLMMVVYGMIIVGAALGGLPGFNSSTFYLMAAIVLGGLLATNAALSGIMQRSSDIVDGR